MKLAAGKGNSTIRCSLHHVDIDSPNFPRYRAVSYQWGKEKFRYHIQVGSPASVQHEQEYGRLRVKRNLLNLLQNIREPGSDCWLWIDAVCIDQSSVEERNSQVRLIGEIYRKADRVLVWLGTGRLMGMRAKRALNFMEEAAEYARKGGSISKYCANVSCKAIACGFVIISRWEYDWHCIAAFCKLGYWWRKWIIQELSSRALSCSRSGLRPIP
jgi:hypothetical protein